MPVADEQLEPRTVAVIGLGTMGRHLADHIAASGRRLRVFDVSEAALDGAPSGAVRGLSAADAASGADVIGIVVVDDEQVRAVLEGENGVLATVKPGSVIAVHSTVRVDSVHDFARLAGAAGAHLVDAGISGGEVGARAGTLVTMVGGDDHSFRRARPVFDTFSKLVVHAGPLGQGMALKLVRNLVGYLAAAATDEGIALARAAGLDLGELVHVLHETPTDVQFYAPFTRHRSGAPVSGDAERERALLAHGVRLAVKDLDDALALGESLGLTLPFAAERRLQYARRS